MSVLRLQRLLACADMLIPILSTVGRGTVLIALARGTDRQTSHATEHLLGNRPKLIKAPKHSVFPGENAMSTMIAEPNSDTIDVSKILQDGTFHVLQQHALKETFYPLVVEAFLDGVEKFEGTQCRGKIAQDGLGQLHRHFPVEKVQILEAYLLKRLRDELYHWSCMVGRETLGLEHPFYVDHLIVFRVHYPFLVARKAQQVLNPPFPWSEKLRIATACLTNPELFANFVRRWKRRRRSQRNEQHSYDAIAYHGLLPKPARAHGPHVDTWYGHSYDGINLWWSIDGVNLDNTIILYPDMFGQPTTFDPVSMYLASGIPVSQPHKVSIEPGELLVFNAEMLHGTQVNISDETRVVVTTRINPGTPRFTPDAPFHFEHWYASTDLEKRKFGSLKVFSSSKYQGQPSITSREAYVDSRTVRKAIDERLPAGEVIEICPSDDLRLGEKMAVDVNQTKILLWRDGDEVRAFARRCPHLGVDLVDGFHDDERVYCPGHGIAFCLADGSSSCEAFKLRQYRAFEEDGKVFVELKAVRDGSRTAAT